MENLPSLLATPAAAVGLGYALQTTHLFKHLDGQTATKLVTWLTLPSLILQSFNGVPLQPLMLPVLGSAALVGAAAAAVSWLLAGRAHPKERGLLSGSAVGAGLALAAYPLVEAAFGAQGLRLALLWGLANSVAVWVGSFLLFASAGAAFPEQYEHTDGGRYRGEWKGMLKEGLGAYTYPSGARYEGEWVENLKEGRGVYHFPRGGVYEGEWRGGRQEGVGVRTFASGKVQAGMWREGRLESPMEERQCALAVEGANEAAAAARRVQVGGGGAQQAAGQLLSDPTTWAYAAAAALAVLGRPLTPTLDLLTGQLATAHAPLALLALGLTLDLQPPQARQMREVTSVLAMRLLPALLLACGAAAVLAGPLGWPPAKVVALVGPLLICGLAPVAPQAQIFAYRFRLNENLAAAITRTTTLAALLLIPLVAAASVLCTWAGTLRPLYAVLGAAMASVAVALAAGLRQRPAGGRPQQQGRPGKVRMVYAGPAGSEVAVPAAGAAAAAAVAAAAPEQAGAASTGSASPASAAAAPAIVEPAATNAEPAVAAQQEQQQAPRKKSAFQDVDGPEDKAEGGAGAASNGDSPAGIDGSSSPGGNAGAPQASKRLLRDRPALPRQPLERRRQQQPGHGPRVRPRAVLVHRAHPSLVPRLAAC